MTSSTEPRTLFLRDAHLQAWNQCWPTVIAGNTLTVCLSISPDGEDVIFGISMQYGSLGPYAWNETVSGNFVYDVSLFTGISLQLNVSQWAIDSSDISFQLKVRLCAVLCVTLYSGTVTVPISGTQMPAELAALDTGSPAELNALLARIPVVVARGCDCRCGCGCGCGCGCAARKGVR